MMINPFSKTDKDRSYIWEMLVSRDIKAFIREDWFIVEDDFIKEGFMGIDGCHTLNPDGWRLNFADLGSYKIEWLKQAKTFSQTNWKEDAETMLSQVTILRDIEIKGDSAIAHKKFIGNFLKATGEKVPANWQSIYNCRCINGKWKIAGFTGYLPHFADGPDHRPIAEVQAPDHLARHKTAGPYSPVLIVAPGKLVVISGQAAIDGEGNITGSTIEEQAIFTLENCRKQLALAGCDLDKVFKVTVFLKNIADWHRFNAVYKEYFKNTLPVRTAVQAGLLDTLLVEIELWAVI